MSREQLQPNPNNEGLDQVLCIITLLIVPNKLKWTRLSLLHNKLGTVEPFLFLLLYRASLDPSSFVVSIMNPEIINKVHNGVSNTMFWSSKNNNNNSGAIFSASSGTNNVQSNLKRQQHPFQRKQRRCWSPELHRRFVSALQQLGGSQVATPKQIRELMHVDGLTNDEVKSHLQKYRLHVNRVPCVSSTLGSHSVVIVGNSWAAQDQYENGDFKSSDLQSGSPQGPLNLEGANCGISLTTGGNSTDDEGDRKSENYNAEDRVLADQQ
ncbi:hypothetical protein MKW92_021513 [Papaver armeniacum]|nr:hypothetical protein MKW92_021513 [Papaver armeniacum]